ncbi:hypothetical protein EIP91_000916 [Steccherinum ochraceum]|uniref:Uncharacterized protein n=1 Tax=Steccherinum ochraceum TaxID=92696 RepID=A0A4R0RSR1_9APHY|nr:hypothetical protein EIP91_000916 [Steccherinum ochraceum]
MPLFGSKDKGSQDPETREMEKAIDREARDEQKTFDHAVKDLRNAESSHNKGIKAADSAQSTLEKAVKSEHKTADALNKAQHQHENALSNQSSAEKTLGLKQQHEQRLQQSLEQRKQALETIQQRKDANDQRREAKLSDLHAHANQKATAASVGQLHGYGESNGNGNAPASDQDTTGTGQQYDGSPPGIGPAGAGAGADPEHHVSETTSNIRSEGHIEALRAGPQLQLRQYKPVNNHWCNLQPEALPSPIASRVLEVPLAQKTGTGLGKTVMQSRLFRSQSSPVPSLKFAVAGRDLAKPEARQPVVKGDGCLVSRSDPRQASRPPAGWVEKARRSVDLGQPTAM